VEADVILGPYGAGLVNIVFSDSPTIIEIYQKKTSTPIFTYYLIYLKTHSIQLLLKQIYIETSSLMWRNFVKSWINSKSK